MATAPVSRTPVDFAGGLAPQQRVLPITSVRKVDGEGTADNPVFELSFSSDDTIVPRWWGGERLSHDKGAMNLDRVNEGAAPFLVNHDPDKLVGRVLPNSVTVKDGVARAKVQMGRSELAKEIRQDMEDGIRPNVSVSYVINEMVLAEQRTGEEPIYDVTKWETLEISTVSVPADPTVGLGRSQDESKKYPIVVKRSGQSTATADKQEHSMATPATPATAAAAVDVNLERTNAITPNVSASRAIRNYARVHKVDESKIDKWIADGIAVDHVRALILADLEEKAKAGVVAPVRVNMSEQEDRQYSMMRAIRSLVYRAHGEKLGDDVEAGFEREISDGIAKHLGRPTQGIYVPTNLRLMKTGHVSPKVDAIRQSNRALNTLTAGPGGATVETDLVAENFIELLRNLMYVKQLGATVLSDLKDFIAFPKQLTPGTLVWTAENAAAIAQADMTFGQVTMSPKTAMSGTSWTRQLLTQSSLDVENLARTDIAAIHALGLDLAAIAGTGAGGQPTGILNQAGIGVIALATNGAAPNYGNLVDCITGLKNNNIPITGPKFMTTPGIEGTLRKTAKISNTAGIPIWGEDNKLVGYDAVSTNQVPSNLTKGTSVGVCHAIILGEFQHLWMAEWGVLELVVDPYTKALQGVIQITSFFMVDIALRYATAFQAIKDALAV
jgi:HK97 family phage major capsid protein